MILDATSSGNAAVFMKYKAAYFALWEFVVPSTKNSGLLEKGKEEELKDRMARYLISALRGGGNAYLDFQEFHSTGDHTAWTFFKDGEGDRDKDGNKKGEWFRNFWEGRKKFLEYENIVAMGKE